MVYESTGPWHRGLEEALAARLPLARVNAMRARRFAQAMGQEAKTDAVDARVLARMGAAFELRLVEASSSRRRELEELTSAREALVKDRTAAGNRGQLGGSGAGGPRVGDLEGASLHPRRPGPGAADVVYGLAQRHSVQSGLVRKYRNSVSGARRRRWRSRPSCTRWWWWPTSCWRRIGSGHRGRLGRSEASNRGGTKLSRIGRFAIWILFRDRGTFRFVSNIIGFSPSPSTPTRRVRGSVRPGQRTFRAPNSKA